MNSPALAIVSLAAAAALGCAACSADSPTPSSGSPTSQPSDSSPSPVVASGLTYRDADYGWTVTLPAGWIALTAASTRQEKYFVTIDPRIDPNQRNFNLQPGDARFDVLVDATPAVPASACLTPQQNPGQTSRPTTVDGVATTLYRWQPQPDAAVYYLYAVSRGHCYPLSFGFRTTDASSQDATVDSILGSFRFGS